MTKNLFIDIETTGLDFSNNGIVQISGIIEIDDVFKESFNYYIKPFPGDKIDKQALVANNLTINILTNDKRFINPIEVHKKLLNLFSRYIDKFNKKDKFNFIGYNSQAFDFPFLRSWFKKCGDIYFGSWFWSPSIDIMPIWAYLLAPERSMLGDFKLVSVTKYLGLSVDEN